LPGTVTFKYDPFGRRIYKSSSSGTTIYAYDGDNAIETTSQSGAILSRFAQGQNIDEPLAVSTSGGTDYYEADGLGSVTSLTNGIGTVAQTYTYDSFGKTTNSTGSIANSFRYTARDFDSETSLYYYRARFYDPSTGRFLSEDPSQFGGDNSNFYAYVGSEPTDFTDPDGLCANEPNRFTVCAKAYYGIPTITTRIFTIGMAVPFPKIWVGLPRALGSGALTNLPSWLSVGAGTAASGSNWLRMGGRIAGPVAIASVIIDATALTMCTTDYVPNWLYTVQKYDPF
jgi:RHS repeat-associated protein